METTTMTIEKPTVQCAHCGAKFDRTKGGKTITHDFPPPARSVCPGSGEAPRRSPDTPLWKDEPLQRAKDFWEAIRIELLVSGFAVAKEMAALTNQQSGTMMCPLCLGKLKFSVSPTNKHFRAACATEGCIKCME